MSVGLPSQRSGIQLGASTSVCQINLSAKTPPYHIASAIEVPSRAADTAVPTVWTCDDHSALSLETMTLNAQTHPPITSTSTSTLTSTPKFKILYFASARTFTHRESETLDAPLKLTSLFDVLETRYPGIKAKVLDSCAVTLNLDYVDIGDGGGVGGGGGVSGETVIGEGDEIAIIPPVSSG